MSLTVGTISGITIMGQTAEMYTNGAQLWVMDLGFLLGMIVVAEFFIPIFYPLKIINMYEVIGSNTRYAAFN